MSGAVDVERLAKDMAEREVLDITSLGGKVKLVKRTQVPFTEERATWLLQEVGELPGDRSVRDKHVEYLAECMKRGTFLTELVQLAVCTVGGKVFRVNGQHCAWARITVGKEWQPDGAKVTLLEYEAGEAEDLRLLYASFDRAAPRTRAHVTQSHLKGCAEFERVKPPVLVKLPAGLAVWLWEKSTERSRHDADAVAFRLKTDHLELALKVGGFLSKYPPSTNKHLFRSSVIAAMFATFNMAASKGKEFWTTVADGVGISESDDPRNLLRTIILSCTVSAGSVSGRGKKRVSAEALFRYCIVAWNAWRESRQPAYLRVVESDPRPAAV